MLGFFGFIAGAVLILYVLVWIWVYMTYLQDILKQKGQASGGLMLMICDTLSMLITFARIYVYGGLAFMAVYVLYGTLKEYFG